MIESLLTIAQFLVFPGFIFSASAGLLVGWVDRKVTARLQWRVGPPWYQNIFDVLKLAIYKETLVPEGVSPVIFLGMPALALSAATLAATFILTATPSGGGFTGDLIAVVYLLIIPPLALMLGAFASRNPLASLGASREMKLILSYELPFILAIIVPIIKAGYAIKLGSFVIYQTSHGAIVASVSGALSCVVAILCIHAKMGFVPFDMPEAETEIMAGTYIEYSGKALAMFKLAKAVLLIAIPSLLVTLYFGGIIWTFAGILKSLAWYLLVVVVMIVIKNTNPRVRIDQAMKFFWAPVTAVALAAVVVALLGY